MEQPNQTQLKQIKVVPNRLSKPNQNKLHQTKPSRASAAQLLYRPVLVMIHFTVSIFIAQCQLIFYLVQLVIFRLFMVEHRQNPNHLNYGVHAYNQTEETHFYKL